MEICDIEKIIKENTTNKNPEWSLCKVLIDEIPRYFFRVLDLDKPECSGDSIEECVNNYFDN